MLRMSERLELKSYVAGEALVVFIRSDSVHTKSEGWDGSQSTLVYGKGE